MSQKRSQRIKDRCQNSNDVSYLLIVRKPSSPEIVSNRYINVQDVSCPQLLQTIPVHGGSNDRLETMMIQIDTSMSRMFPVHNNFWWGWFDGGSNDRLEKQESNAQSEKAMLNLPSCYTKWICNKCGTRATNSADVELELQNCSNSQPAK